MKLLAFETATEACSVAVLVDGEVRERFEIAPRRHAELALPWAEALLAEAGIARAQLDAIAVGRGPGAFTGVRLGISLAQGMALALGVPVVAVSTLAALALRAGAAEGEQVLAAIDALLAEIGSDKSHMLSCQVFLRDMADFDQWNAVWDQWVDAARTPARTTVQAVMARPQCRVEVTVTAACA